MNEDEFETIRKKNGKYQKQMEALEQQMKIEDEIKRNIRKILDDKAYERLMNVKLVNYKLFIMASQYIIQIAPKLGGRQLTEKELIRLLQNLGGGSSRRDVKIIRK